MIRKPRAHRRGPGIFAAALLALLALFALTTSSAIGAQLSFSFGEKGSGNGQFQSPGGVVATSSDVWVVDSGNNRVEKFNLAGEYVSQFGKKGHGNGQFESPGEIEVDSNGNLWVLDRLNERIEEFNSKGEYLAQFELGGYTPTGFALDPSGGFWASVLGICIAKFGVKSQGELLTYDCSGTALEGIAVDSQGNPWVADGGANAILKFSSETEYVSQFGTKGSGNGQFEGPTDLAFDGSGNLWVADNGNNRVQKFNSKAEYVSKFGAKGSGKGQFNGAAALDTGPTGDVWVADRGNNRVQRWVPSRPVVTTEAATSVGVHTAQLNATVNPSGFQTNYHFWYGISSLDSETAEVSAGSGESNVKVSQLLIKLKPNTTYHYRIVAKNAEGAAIGEEKTFTTASAAGTQHWYSCSKGGGSLNYTDSACTEETYPGIGSYGLVKFTEGSAQEVNVKGTSAFNITWENWGMLFEVKCSGATSEESTVENPTGKGAGTFHGRILLTGCSLGGSIECSLKWQPSLFVNGEGTEYESKPAVRFVPSSGSYLFTVETKACPIETTFYFSGKITGAMNGANQLEFTKSSSELMAGAVPATFTGVSKLETPTGKQVVLTP
jgi:DNA-binding beta-propeller fold protein YncE